MKIEQAVMALSALAQESRLEVFRLLVRSGFAGLPAGLIGSRLSVKTDKDRLKKGFGWFLLVIAMLMLLKACF